MRHSLKDFKQRKYLIAGVICLLLISLCLYFFMGAGAKKKKSKVSKPLVETYEVLRKDMNRTVNLSGQTVADAHVVLAPKYTGRITQVLVELGDHVKAGDILMVQDTGDLEISIMQNQAATMAASADAVEAAATYNANYIKTKNAYEIAKQRYNRNEYLHSIGAISQENLDSVREEFLASQAAYEILENQSSEGMPASVASKKYTADKNNFAVQALEKQLSDMYIRAPRDGVIGYRAAEVGAIASAGTKVFELVDNGHVYVDCNIPETDAAVLGEGMDVEVTIDAIGATIPGKLIYVSPAMSDSSKSYTVRIELDKNHSGIKSGLFAKSKIEFLQRENTLFVPKEAVVTRNGQQYVFVVNADNTVKKRMVKIGLINDDYEEIIEGLQAGDVVATTNQDRLQDGTEVEVSEA